MMNLSSVMGSEPLIIAYPFHLYKHIALYTHHSGCLAEYIQMYSLWFCPGIYLPDFEKQSQEELYMEEYVGACAN